MPDHRDPDRILHTMHEMLMARASAIACGYEDANDLDRLRHDPKPSKPSKPSRPARPARRAKAAKQVAPAKKSNPAKPAVKYVLLGADEYAKPRAARFSAEDPALLAKAAETMFLRLVEVTDPEVAEIAAQAASRPPACQR